MSKSLLPSGPSRQTKQILIVAGAALAVLAVYEFSANAGQAAGAEIGTGVIVLLVGAVLAVGVVLLL